MPPRPRLLALGSVNLDLKLRADRYPAPGESLCATDFAAASGGKAANVASCARRLGADAGVLGRVGDDEFARMALQPLQEAGVDLTLVKRATGEPTGVALVVLQAGGEKTILFAGNANDAWRDEDMESAEAAIAEAHPGSVLVADVEVTPAVVERIGLACRARGLRTILDPSPARRVGPHLLSSFDFITPNPAEAAALTGMAVRSAEDALRAGRALQARSRAQVLTKLPDGGCAVVSESNAFVVSTPPVQTVDKTGAGDAFAGTLAVALLEGRPLEQGARLAAAASALAVGRHGTQSAYGQKSEIERFAGLVTVAHCST